MAIKASIGHLLYTIQDRSNTASDREARILASGMQSGW